MSPFCQKPVIDLTCALPLIQMAEIAMLADFDAVSVSTYQLDRLEWNVARCTPREIPQESVVLRAGQARYPAQLLREDGKFLKRVSRESRRMIEWTLYAELGKLGRAMQIIEGIVLEEVDVELELARNPKEPHTRPASLTRSQGAPTVRIPSSSSVRDPGAAADPVEPTSSRSDQDEDEVF